MAVLAGLVVIAVVAAVLWMMDTGERGRLVEKLSGKLSQEEVDSEEDAMIERLEQMRVRGLGRA